jgi:alcohol dehydrogenase class IV
MQDLGNPQLRAEMAQAALMAGLAFSNTKTALAHSLSYDITLQHGVPHGMACSFSLPLVLEMALGADPVADAALLSIFDAMTPALAGERLRAVLHQLGVPPTPPTTACTRCLAGHGAQGRQRPARAQLHPPAGLTLSL